MSSVLLLLIPTLITSGLAVLCYVLLYQDTVLVIQRAFFFRVGVGASISAVIGVGALLTESVPTHLLHAVFAVSVAMAVHAVSDGLHPDTEPWFYSLFRP
jgi:hypothetical protein